MSKINKHIEIVSSTGRGLSSMGKKSRDGAFVVLSKHYSDVRITILNNSADLEALADRQPDLVFLGMNFVPADQSLRLYGSNRIWVTEYLDERGIAYTGSDRMAHELEIDKPLAKQCIINAGLNTAPFYVAAQNRELIEDNISFPYPIFIKPTSHGGGAGVDSNSVAHNFKQLHSKVKSITSSLQSDSLLEKYLPGREFSVAILKDERRDEYSVMPIELVAPPDEHGVRILSHQVKVEDRESFIEVTDKNIRYKLSALAIGVFEALGARDYGRIDIRLDKAGVPQFLEANLIPSLIEGFGNFPKACLLNIGLNYENMILRIARLGLAHNIENSPGPVAANNIIFPALEVAEAL